MTLGRNPGEGVLVEIGEEIAVAELLDSSATAIASLITRADGATKPVEQSATATARTRPSRETPSPASALPSAATTDAGR